MFSTLCQPSALWVPGSWPARLHGFNSPFFCTGMLTRAQGNCGGRSWAVGLLLLLAGNGKQKMAWERFGREGNFSVSSSLEKSIFSHPCLTAEGGGLQTQPRRGWWEGESRGGRKCPVISQGWSSLGPPALCREWSPTCFPSVPKIHPIFSPRRQGLGMPQARLGIFGVLCVRSDVTMLMEMQWWVSAGHWLP